MATWDDFLPDQSWTGWFGPDLTPITGTGAGAQAAATGSGSGAMQFAGIGSGVQSPATSAGTGTVTGGIATAPVSQGLLLYAPRRLEPTAYVGPTSRSISKQEIAAARRRFQKKRSEEEWLLGLVDQLEAA